MFSLSLEPGSVSKVTSMRTGRPGFDSQQNRFFFIYNVQIGSLRPSPIKHSKGLQSGLLSFWIFFPSAGILKKRIAFRKQNLCSS